MHACARTQRQVYNERCRLSFDTNWALSWQASKHTLLWRNTHPEIGLRPTVTNPYNGAHLSHNCS
jgi:hypothetical protein